MITFAQIKKDPDIQIYIQKADSTLAAMGFTEHAFAHMGKCSQMAKEILRELGYNERTVELARIAGYLHDIGNVINRTNHAQSGAMMAFSILERMGMGAEELSTVVTAIGHHDEQTAFPVSAVSAALILADKSDVRRSRVRNQDFATFDIHDRVNYAVEHSQLDLSVENKTITLDIVIDNSICSVMDYFEIFMHRMLLCRRAADFFGLKFRLVINGTSLL